MYVCMVAVKATSLLQGHLVEQSVLQLQTVTMQAYQNCYCNSSTILSYVDLRNLDNNSSTMLSIMLRNLADAAYQNC